MYKQKWPPPKERPLLCREIVCRLNLQEAPRHTERAEGRAEQHYCGTAIGNPSAAGAEQRPMGEAVWAKPSSRNRHKPGQPLDIPNFITSIWAVELPKQICKTAGAKVNDYVTVGIKGETLFLGHSAIKNGCWTRAATSGCAGVSVCPDYMDARTLGN